ncbi:MAG: universal stress protein [Pseudomonadota bacterium]
MQLPHSRCQVHFMYERLLAPTDGSVFSNKAVSTAARLAHALHAGLLVLHVRSTIEVPHHVQGGALNTLGEKKIMQEIEDEERKLLDASLAIAVANGVTAETAFVADEAPYNAIIRIAQDQHCDLILMASHGRGGIAGIILGSETQKVLTHTTIPVLVVR